MAKQPVSKDDNGRRLSALDRAIQTAIGDGRTVGSDTDPGRDKYPALWEWLSRIYIGLDRVKTPATITIALGPTGVLISLSDRDLGVSCGAVCEHIDDSFAALERALTAAVAPVRSWGKKEPRLRKKGGQ